MLIKIISPATLILWFHLITFMRVITICDQFVVTLSVSMITTKYKNQELTLKIWKSILELCMLLLHYQFISIYVVPRFFLHLLLLAISRYIWVRSLTTKSAKFCSSYSRMQGPGICLWFSDRSNWSHWNFEATVLPISHNINAGQRELIILYYAVFLLLVIQLCSPIYWHFLFQPLPY